MVAGGGSTLVYRKGSPGPVASVDDVIIMAHVFSHERTRVPENADRTVWSTCMYAPQSGYGWHGVCMYVMVVGMVVGMVYV